MSLPLDLLTIIIVIFIIYYFLFKKKFFIFTEADEITFYNSMTVVLKEKTFFGKEIEISNDKIEWKIAQGGTINNNGILTVDNQERNLVIIAILKNQLIKTQIKTQIKIVKPRLEIFEITVDNSIMKPQEFQLLKIYGEDHLGYELKGLKIEWTSNPDYCINNQIIKFLKSANGEYNIKATAIEYQKSSELTRCFLF